MRRISILAFMLAALLALTGCQERFEWHEKLTVTVETPSGEVSGSAVVRQVSLVGQMPMAANAVVYEITGEATVVDMGSGRYLFALLNGVEERAVRTFKSDDMQEPIQYFAAAQNARSAKPLVGPQPMLVTFENIADPQSVKLVDPDDLDATFGMCPDGSGLKDADAPWRAEKVSWRTWARAQVSGMSLKDYLHKETHNNGFAPGWIESFDKKATPRDKTGDCRSLRSITLEITDEKATEGKVEKLLPWLIEAGRTRYSVVEMPPNPGPFELLSPEQRVGLSGFLTSDHWREE